MRHIASLTLALALCGCGYDTWWNPSFTGGYNPNLPVSDSENMRRVLGQEPSVSPLTTDPGDIWPVPWPQAPTLKDLEATGGLTPQPEAPVPGSPRVAGWVCRPPSPNPPAGNSIAPGSVQPRPFPPQFAPPLSDHTSPPTSPTAPSPAGQVDTDPQCASRHDERRTRLSDNDNARRRTIHNRAQRQRD